MLLLKQSTNRPCWDREDRRPCKDALNKFLAAEPSSLWPLSTPLSSSYISSSSLTFTSLFTFLPYIRFHTFCFFPVCLSWISVDMMHKLLHWPKNLTSESSISQRCAHPFATIRKITFFFVFKSPSQNINFFLQITDIWKKKKQRFYFNGALNVLRPFES